MKSKSKKKKTSGKTSAPRKNVSQKIISEVTAIEYKHFTEVKVSIKKDDITY